MVIPLEPRPGPDPSGCLTLELVNHVRISGQQAAPKGSVAVDGASFISSVAVGLDAQPQVVLGGFEGGELFELLLEEGFDQWLGVHGAVQFG